MPFPDYPSNARSFIHLDAKLLPYWHLLFDVCPALLRIDPPDGLGIFKQFMAWAYRKHPPLDWTFHLSVCQWLLGSDYAQQIKASHVETLLVAAAAKWTETDGSQARGILLSHGPHGLLVTDWKPGMALGDMCTDWDEGSLPPPRWDFAWAPLRKPGAAGFQRWLKALH
ncbi:TPA: putative natural product biosynthesis protein [Pseudomonas aeruginosa]